MAPMAYLGFSVPLLLFAVLLVLAIYWAVKSRTGRWVVGISAIILVLFAPILVPYLFLHKAHRVEFPAAQQTAATQRTSVVQLDEDFTEWKKAEVFQVIQTEPSRKEWVEKGGSDGEIAGYSGLLATREEALKAAQAALADKVKALVMMELAKKKEEAGSPAVQKRVEDLVSVLLQKPGTLADRYEESVLLPQSKEKTYRAAVLAKVPDDWIMRTGNELIAGLRGERKTWAWTVFSAGVLALVIFLIYSFLNAGSKGHMAWPLRLISISVFILLCLGLLYVRGYVP